MDDGVKHKSARRKFRKSSKASTFLSRRFKNVKFYQMAIALLLWWLLLLCLIIVRHLPKTSPARKTPLARVSVPRTHTFPKPIEFLFPSSPFNCQERSFPGSAAPHTYATAVVSLYNIQYISQAVFFFKRVVKYLPQSLVNDIIVTADDKILAPAKAKITDTVSGCDVCRLYFLGDGVYNTQARVARFAHNPVIVFIDARLLLLDNVVEDLVGLTRLHPRALISPQLSLFDGKHMVTSVGVYRSELTWGLQAARAPVDVEDIEAALNTSEKVINQTVVQREMFAVRKDFFKKAADKTLFTSVTTDSHVLLSILALKIGGNVLTSLCSRVYLGIHDKIHGSETNAFGPGLSNKNKNWFYSQTDFLSPTFQLDVEREKLGTVSSESALQLTDPLSTIFRRVASPSLKDSSLLLYQLLSTVAGTKVSHVPPLFSDPLMASLRQRQPEIFQHPKCSRFLGYMRSLDGMYALGVDKDSVLYPWLILTRNSSLWLGPVAFTGKHLSIKTAYVTQRSHSLYLSPLLPTKSTSQEFYFFQDQLVAINGTRFVLACATLNSRKVSVRIFMSPSCPHGASKFKFDVEFKTKDDCEARAETGNSTVG